MRRTLRLPPHAGPRAGFLVATRGGDVIYERFFDRFTELEKAEIRAAFSCASSNVRMSAEEQDFIAPYK
jgi:hypothetical protein